MRDEYDDFSNPFDKDNVWMNIWDGLFPSSRALYSRDEVLQTNATLAENEEKESLV